MIHYSPNSTKISTNSERAMVSIGDQKIIVIKIVCNTRISAGLFPEGRETALDGFEN